MVSVFSTREECCGCSACAQSCPQQAIAMKADVEGFLYPRIDMKRCVDCGICRNICPVLHDDTVKERGFSLAYAAKHKEESVRMTSASGGAFTAISDFVLRQKGVVYGVDFTEDFSVCHKRAETAAERDRFKMSKYVQSDLRDTFAEIKADLVAGRVVLFTGTPCQAAGLRSFIGKARYAGNLYIADVMCYGIPSPLIWREYLHYLEEKYQDAIEGIEFRSKIFEWDLNNSGKTFMFTTKKGKKPYVDNDFYALFFLARTIMRPSCYQCKFADCRRPSDVTIADYWRIEKYLPEIADKKGVSLLLLNSVRGKELFERIKADFVYSERPPTECLPEQPRLRKPVRLPENRSQFWQDYRERGFLYLLDHYVKRQ